ncbi:MAG: replicative DNA helicase [Candidatus Sumerlaeia bacterium]|nr:replicative DNA helicase [Candidatus Sumerlaeia bacterium]
MPPLPPKKKVELDPTRTLPHNLDAERAVLGSILIDASTIPIVSDLLRAEDFYSTAHQRIFEAVLRLSHAGKPVDLMTLADEIRRADQMEAVGGLAYLSTLEQHVLSTANVAHHALIVRQKSRLRRLIIGTTEILDDCYRDERDPDEIFEDAQKKVFEIAHDRLSRSFTHVSGIVDRGLEFIQRRRSDHTEITGVKTHFDHLDQMTLGFQPSDLIIIAARPSMGKTAFALNIAANVALFDGKPVGIFSLEMSADQIQQRLLSSLARVPMYLIRSGYLSHGQFEIIQEKARILKQAPLYIDDTSALNIQDLRARARRLKVEVPDLAMLVIDYIQLMRGSERASRESRQREVAEIAGELKALARQLNIPIVALSQLSRLIEQRERTIARPKLSDLRESGALEQDADVVMFVHRNPAHEPPLDQTLDDGQQPEPVRASIIIGKQRNGPTGEVQMLFVRQFTQFVTLARDYWERR